MLQRVQNKYAGVNNPEEKRVGVSGDNNSGESMKSTNTTAASDGEICTLTRGVKGETPKTLQSPCNPSKAKIPDNRLVITLDDDSVDQDPTKASTDEQNVSSHYQI